MFSDSRGVHGLGQDGGTLVRTPPSRETSDHRRDCSCISWRLGQIDAASGAPIDGETERTTSRFDGSASSSFEQLRVGRCYPIPPSDSEGIDGPREGESIPTVCGISDGEEFKRFVLQPGPARTVKPSQGVDGRVQRGSFPLCRGSRGVPLIRQNATRAGGWEDGRKCYVNYADAARKTGGAGPRPTGLNKGTLRTKALLYFSNVRTAMKASCGEMI